MNGPGQKPQTLEDLLALLEAAQDDLGKGGRRLARFFIESPEAAALLSAADVASQCDVHASSVVRLAQGLGLSGYREFQSLLQQSLTPKRLGTAPAMTSSDRPLRMTFLAESGRSFNEAAQQAALRTQAANPLIEITTQTLLPHMINPTDFAQHIKNASEKSDGIILVAREHPAINNAVRDVTQGGIPVICLTSDLPSSGRTAYVGSDQFASGSTAGWLCGRFLRADHAQKVLLVSSVPFRCQLDREQGFRQVLRSEFPWLTIDEKVASDESPDVAYEAVRRYVAKNGAPAAIYNVSGANLGIGRALEAEGLVGATVFIGHELNANSRKLLESSIMDLTIGHDFEREMAMAVACIQMVRDGSQPVNNLTQSQIFTRHNCTAT